MTLDILDVHLLLVLKSSCFNIQFRQRQQMEEYEPYLGSEKSSRSPSPTRRLSREASPHIRRSPVASLPRRKSRSRSRSRSRAFDDSYSRSCSNSSCSEDEGEAKYKRMSLKEKKIANREDKAHNLLLERRLNRIMYTLYNEVCV